MRKKILFLLCTGILALSLAGCEDKKDDKKERNEKTEASTEDFKLPIGNGIEKTEEQDPEEPPVTEEPVTDSDWVLGGCEETGYLEVPADWSEHKTTVEDDKYGLQYTSPAQDGLISVFNNDYNYDAELHDVDDPAQVVINSYIEQYANLGAENIKTEEIMLNGIDFYKSIDYIPAGGLTDYDYYLYTYVTYISYADRFYSFVIEGDESVIEEPVEKAEETFTISEGSDDGNANTPSGPVTASSDWENYEVVIDGELYTLPCDFSELEAKGWSLDDYYEDERIAYDDYSFVSIVRDGQEIRIVVANQTSESNISAREGQLIGVIFDYQTEEMDCSIAGNITLGKDYDDVVSAFGTPDDVYEDNDYKVLKYDSDADYRAGLEITIEGGKVTQIELISW